MGGPATSASLFFPQGLAVDKSGNVFISDYTRIRRVDGSTGIITTIAGNGTCAFSGDGGQAAKAELCAANVAVDGLDNLYIADATNERIRRIDGKTGVITTVAGNGQTQYCGNVACGDGGPATSASLSGPQGLALDSYDDIYIADTYDSRIRRVDASTGIITTVAGNGQYGFGVDGVLATLSELTYPQAIALDSAGNLFVADTSMNAIREVNAATQIISTVAGNRTPGYMGDGGSATKAQLNAPSSVAIGAAGVIYIADQQNQRVRQVSSAGIIATFAGGGNGGDGGPATQSTLASARVTADSSDNIYIADSLANRVRRVDGASGVISEIAGTGVSGFGGDGGTASAAEMNYPQKAAFDSSGNVFIPDTINTRIRRVDGGTQEIATVAGGTPLTPGCVGDGGPATSACLWSPQSVALDLAGDLFIADSLGNRIRKVDAATQVISTVAGDGTAGYSGDAGPAVSAELRAPDDITLDSAGNLFIADFSNHRIRRVDAATKFITTVAGNGTASYCGDGGPATKACLNYPSGVAVDQEGNLYIADNTNNRVRRVDAVSQIITTIAGDGTPGFSGDGGPSTSAELDYPISISVDGHGNLFVADAGNRVREFSIAGIAGIAPASLNFINQNVGTTSAAQVVSLSNSGSESLAIAGIALSGTNAEDFAETNTCGSSLAAGASCTINITFKPTSAESRAGTLTITDNSSGKSGSTQALDLTGTGVAAEVTLGAVTPAITPENVGMSSPASTVTLTNSGNASLTISAIVISGAAAKDFTMQSSSTCSTKAAVATGKSCTVDLVFTPSVAGSRTATLTITDNANDAASASQSVALSAGGKDFTLAASKAVSISPGQSATYTVTITSQSGFSGTVQLSCSEPAGLTESSCTASPDSPSVNSSSAATASVTVRTTAPSLVPLARTWWPSHSGTPNGAPLLLLFVVVLGTALVALAGTPKNSSLTGLGVLLSRFATRDARRSGKHSRNRFWWALLVPALMSVFLWGSCGGGGSNGSQSNPGTPAGTYSLTITATSGSITQTAALSLKVQ
jgi:sugar lactone lactonase YvrE